MATNENAAEVVSRFSDPVFFGTPTEGGPRVPPTPGPSGDNASTPGPSGDAKHLLQAPKAATPTSLMLAIFKDSVEAEIPGFTFKEWQQRQETNKGTKLRKAPSMREGRQKTKGKLRIAPSMWEGRQKTSGTKLRITMKKDRGQLMILKEDSEQICQIKIKNCGKDHDKGSEIALRIMTAVGEAYASDKVARDMLRKMRDEKLAELVPSSNLLKKQSRRRRSPQRQNQHRRRQNQHRQRHQNQHRQRSDPLQHTSRRKHRHRRHHRRRMRHRRPPKPNHEARSSEVLSILWQTCCRRPKQGLKSSPM